MAEWFLAQSPVMQALLGTCFTWFMTALGAGVVFSFKSINRKVMDGMLGSAAGVMIAASFWSLLAPAIAMVEEAGGTPWIPALAGSWAVAPFSGVSIKSCRISIAGSRRAEAEGIKTSWQRSVLLVLAITLHNIPEGSGGRGCFRRCRRRTPCGLDRCRDRSGHRYWYPEFSRGCCRLRAAQA